VSKVTPVPFALTRISVKDFGPVKEADVHLGKVTVLMGPNNTGKTYFTLLVPILDELVGTWRFARARLAPPKYTLEDFELHLNKILFITSCTGFTLSNLRS
jgi:predicted ATPase